MEDYCDVLIIDDNMDDYELCQRMLANKQTALVDKTHFQLKYAPSGQQGLDQIDQKIPHCVLLDYSLPGNDGLAVLEQIRKKHAQLPIVVMTGQGNEKIAVNLLKAGAQDYIVKGEIRNQNLSKIITNAIASSHADIINLADKKSAPLVLIVDDNPDDRELVTRTLNKAYKNRYRFIEATTSIDAMQKIEQQQPNCILLDYSLPGENGLEIMKKIAVRYPFLPVIIFSGQGSEHIAAEAIKNGAFHYLVKSDITPELLHTTIKQGQEKKNLERVVSEKNLEIKRYQQESTERQRRFERVVQATNIVVWECDLETSEVFIDEQFANLLGHNFNNRCLKLSELRNLVHPDDQSLVNEHWQAHLQGHSTELRSIYRMRHKDGSWRWIRETGKIIATDSSGKPLQVAGLYEDINERKREEEILNQLYTATTNISLSLEEKINIVFQLGLEYFGLTLGVVGSIADDTYTILFSSSTGKLSPGQVYPIKETYCAHAFGTNEVYAWHDASNSTMQDELCFKKHKLNTYIGTTIFINNKPYGTLSFFQQSPRLKPFTNREKSFLRLMAQWVSFEITRKKNLEAIEESNHFLQLIQDSIPDMIFVKDDQFRIVRANPAFLSVYPQSVRDSVMGTTTLESYSDDEAQAFLYHDKIALQEGFSETEESIQFPDGKRRTLHTQKTCFQDKAKKNYILGVARDVTDRKQAEKRIAESEERYQLAVRGASVGLWDWNVLTGELFWSARFKEIVGISDDDFRPRYEEFSDRLHPEDKERVEKALFGHVENKTPYNVEYRLKRTDNMYVWIHARGQAIWDSDGNATRMAGSVDDITERKKAEQSLANSEERYQLAVRGASVGLWDWNVITGELFWSARFKEIVGISNHDFRPRYEEFSDRLHPEDKENVENALFGHLENKTPYDVEYRLKRTDNEYIWIHARGQAIWDNEGNATRMAGSVDDITEKKIALDEILRSNTELERFAYVASHDLQEPLRMVNNFTQLLEKHYGKQLDTRALEYIHFASNGALRMQTLVRDLLEYARIGHEAENYETINLNNLKSSILDNLASAIEQSNASIQWQELPVVRADPVRIRSVFQNLIGNAIKYQKKGVSPKISVCVVSSANQWQFSITDNGIGMKQQYCDKIFEPFKRLHPKEEYPGTGMGLSICRKIVEGLGGKIWAVSEPDEGTTFHFNLLKLNP